MASRSLNVSFWSAVKRGWTAGRQSDMAGWASPGQQVFKNQSFLIGAGIAPEFSLFTGAPSTVDEERCAGDKR